MTRALVAKNPTLTTCHGLHLRRRQIRTLRLQSGELGPGEKVAVGDGRVFAINDRIRFQRNERDRGVKNGSLGIIEGIESGVLSVKLDGTETRVHVETKFYKHLDYGYAATVHKAQGSTVDRSYVLATTTSIATPPTFPFLDTATTPPSSTPATISAAAPTMLPSRVFANASPKPSPAPDPKNSPTIAWNATRKSIHHWCRLRRRAMAEEPQHTDSQPTLRLKRQRPRRAGKPPPTAGLRASKTPRSQLVMAIAS